MKFKVGDVLKEIKNTEDEFQGSIYTITAVDLRNYYYDIKKPNGDIIDWHCLFEVAEGEGGLKYAKIRATKTAKIINPTWIEKDGWLHATGELNDE